MTAHGRGSTTAWSAPGRVLPAGATPHGIDGGVPSEPPVSVSRPRRGRLAAIIVTARPRQWVKNLLVIAAAGAAGALGREGVPTRVGLAFIAFCLLSAGIYALNDVRDVAEDRLHPRKRFRPIAAGELPRTQALVFGVSCVVGGLVLSFAIRPLLGLVAVGYLVSTVSYTVLWRHVVVLDILVVALGFVLRALAGGAAAPVALSRWFVLVVTAAAFFVAAGKRHAELVRTRRTPAPDGAGRRVMRHYSEGGLRLLLSGSGAVALFAYAVWALQDPDGIPWRLFTVIPFAACLIRYGLLIRRGGGEAPEETLLSDRVLLGGGVLWLILFALSVHATT
ncbi:MAG TPA: decaprenyl-phosphate phosphoribosyltransferase [Solirubrobacteraceae bacterium]|nr:decaprenyl-phosphate phosphoribosyltransferase [Solirubrobacteraceae bacterium]